MRRIGILLTLTLGAVAIATDTGGWASFSSTEGRFSVLMPGKPQKMKQALETQVGPIDLHVFVTPVGDEAAYFVCYSDYPADKMAGMSADTILDATKSGLSKGKGRTLKSERSITHQGLPGREFVWGTPEGHVGTVRIILKKNRLFQAMVMKRTASSPADQAKFFQSFKMN